jgi:hypothetical protein
MPINERLGISQAVTPPTDSWQYPAKDTYHPLAQVVLVIGITSLSLSPHSRRLSRPTLAVSPACPPNGTGRAIRPATGCAACRTLIDTGWASSRWMQRERAPGDMAEGAS